MLRECRTHGYFRAEECPICGEKGRFFLNQEELDIIGRTMAGVLRHFPERYNLDMDDHGWVDLKSFVDAVQIRQGRFRWLRSHHILAVIDTDPKGRYQFRDGKIRATYAHSVDIDLDLPTRDIPDELFYPTTKEELDILMETGLKPSDRKRVHLSKAYENALDAGRVRDPFPIIMKIDTKAMIEDGLVIMRAGTTVFLTDEVDPKYITVMEESLGPEVPEATGEDEEIKFTMDEPEEAEAPVEEEADVAEEVVEEEEVMAEVKEEHVEAEVPEAKKEEEPKPKAKPKAKAKVKAKAKPKL
ncbi:MAG: RNA 2'-phosphotransferase, partial [Thermoplasmata archaeon]|nr:RNA 2'-phosphotransferase [Thermoplasmata archaeon]